MTQRINKLEHIKEKKCIIQQRFETRSTKKNWKGKIKMKSFCHNLKLKYLAIKGKINTLSVRFDLSTLVRFLLYCQK